MMNQINEDIK